LDLLITLDLADPLLLSATCLADLIPDPDEEVREAVASTTAETGGQWVGCLADGLNLVPQKYRGTGKSILTTFPGYRPRTISSQGVNYVLCLKCLQLRSILS